MSAHPTDAAAIAALHELVATPSVSGHEALAATRFVRIAGEIGFDARIDEAGNGVARRGPRDERVTVCMLGHIDTVPGEVPVRVSEGVLHGRGSVDAKGPLVAHLFGAARAQLPADVAVVVVAAVGEETSGSPGARHLVRTLSPDACVIAEPSGWQGVTLGYKGRLLARATYARDGAHSAGPGGSACDALLAWWSEARTLCDGLAGAEGTFDQVQHTVQGMASEHDGLTEHASLHAGFRLPPSVPPEDLEPPLAALAAAHGVTLAFDGRERAHRSDRNDAVARALTAAVRAEGGSPRPIVKTGTSDMCVVAPHWRCPIAAYGPGDSTLDHTPAERLDLAEFLRSIAVLRRALELLAHELPGAQGDEPMPSVVTRRAAMDTRGLA